MFTYKATFKNVLPTAQFHLFYDIIISLHFFGKYSEYLVNIWAVPIDFFSKNFHFKQFFKSCLKKTSHLFMYVCQSEALAVTHAALRVLLSLASNCSLSLLPRYMLLHM